MDFAFSDEQQEFRGGVRRFLEERCPTAEVFRSLETPAGYDAGLWRQMARELGLQGVHLPEDCGGQGFGPLELGIVQEELGRALVPSPFFSTACLAAGAILEAGSPEERARWLPPLASGEMVATLALLEASGRWEAEGVGLSWRRSGDGFRLAGRKRLVTDAAAADLFVVAARRPGSAGAEGLSLFVVRAGAPGLEVAPVEPLDPTRRLADLAFADVPAELLGTQGAAGPALARTLDRACVALAAESAGGAQRCLESAVAHAKQRVQFGRPIGSFQAIKHKCAEVLLEVESARSAAYWASWVAAEDSAELPLAASVAKSFCGDAYARAAEENLHIHGGMGFTWEAAPQLFFKRARANAALLGDPPLHRARIARLLGL
jgi:alkylation response protein AidB-like acyl-CoA dehydrogenase